MPLYLALVLGWGLALGGCSPRATSPSPPPPAEAAAPVEPRVPPPSRASGPSSRGAPAGAVTSLRAYYRVKHPEEERAAVSRMLEEVVPSYRGADHDQAVAEILGFHHLIFHRTPLHDLEGNHALVRRHEGTLREVSEQLEVPLLPLLALVSWENSGGADKVSWADAAGLGQMTWGAVETAHRYAEAEAERLRGRAREARAAGRVQEAERLQARIARLDVKARHGALARRAGEPDERKVPRCNLEDAALFFKYLLDQYGGRVDLALSAYHNGVLNNDDVLHDFLSRRGERLDRAERDRAALLEALARHQVTFLDLWRDPRSRDMLNGWRTVEGALTGPGNRHLALGDESDLYPWKVLGSLAGYLAGEAWTSARVAWYRGPWDLTEVQGLPAYLEPEACREAAQGGRLVPVGLPFLDPGVGQARLPSRRPWSGHATPELAGYLAGLEERLRGATGHPRLRLPLVRLLGDSLPGQGPLPCPGSGDPCHLRGVAADLAPGRLQPGHRAALDRLLRRDFLLDRVYLTRQGGRVHLVLNPRWGEEFLEAREAASRGGAAGG